MLFWTWLGFALGRKHIQHSYCDICYKKVLNRFFVENDLSEDREDIVESMLTRLAEIYGGGEFVFPTFPWPDPSSNPGNRGGAWTPWLDEE